MFLPFKQNDFCKKDLIAFCNNSDKIRKSCILHFADIEEKDEVVQPYNMQFKKKLKEKNQSIFGHRFKNQLE
jgi:hypothetical protein